MRNDPGGASQAALKIEFNPPFERSFTREFIRALPAMVTGDPKAALPGETVERATEGVSKAWARLFQSGIELHVRIPGGLDHAQNLAVKEVVQRTLGDFWKVLEPRVLAELAQEEVLRVQQMDYVKAAGINKAGN